MSILEERGFFWWDDQPIPDGHFAPASPIPGLLKIEKNGRISLELDGFLPSDKGPLSFLAIEEDLSLHDKSIHGILKTNSKHVSLSNLIRNGGGFSSSGISHERYLALNCLVGDTPFSKKIGSSQFESLEINLKGFEEWLRIGSINFERSKETVSADYKRPEDIVYQLDDGQLLIRYEILGPYLGKNKISSLSLSKSALLIYAPNETKTLEEMKAQYGLIQDLFILLTGSNYNLDWPILSQSQGKSKYRLYFSRNEGSDTTPEWHECWTNFIQLREYFGQIFSNWKNKREEFGPGFYLYLGTRRSIKLYIEHRFVNLIWGIEAFHRKGLLVTARSKSHERIQRILSQITATSDRKWLQRKLKHADEPTLEQRIFETLKQLPLKLDEKRLRDFSSSCAKMRNDISHFGGQRQKTDNYQKFSLDLNAKSDALSDLYHALLLHEIGIEDEILSGWFYEGLHSFRMKKCLVEVGLLDETLLKNITPPQHSASSSSRE